MDKVVAYGGRYKETLKRLHGSVQPLHSILESRPLRM